MMMAALVVLVVLVMPLTALHSGTTKARQTIVVSPGRHRSALATASGQSVAPRRTDDGFSYGSPSLDRYGGSEAWWTNLATTRSSRVLSRISGHMVATITMASAVSIAFGTVKMGVLPSDAAVFVESCALPELPHAAVGSFIGLLLAFRTQQAYDRFWEARGLWDEVFAATRGLVRLSTASRDLGTHEAMETSETVVGLAAAFPYALKQHLRGERNRRELLEAAAVASGCSNGAPAMRYLVAAARQPNLPLAVLSELTHALLPMRLSHGDLFWWQADQHCDQLVAILSKAERINGTPVPLSYSRHTSRFFSVYTFTLPLALCHTINLWLLPPAVAVVSWVIYATEEIGHIIENPFGAGLTDDPENQGENQLEVLPLGRYCADIAADAATIHSAAPVSAEELPSNEDELVSFDEVA